MGVKIKLTNCLNSNLKLNYRMPSDNLNGRANPVLSIILQPRALLNEVELPSQNHYNEFKKQNQTFFDNGIVIEGKTTEKQAQSNNKKSGERATRKAKESANKTIEKIQDGANNVSAKLTITEEKI